MNSPELIGIFLLANPACLFANNLGSIYGSSWYIAVLMFCYLIAFALIKLNKETRSIFIFVIPIIISFFIIITKPGLPLFTNPIGHGMFSFFIGFFVGIGLQKFSNLNQKKKIPIRILSSALSILYLVIFFTPSLKKLFSVLPGGIIVPLIFLIPLLFIFCDLKILNKFCSLKPFTYTANVSFEFYMIHSGILKSLKLVDRSLKSQYWFMICILISIFIISAVLHYLISEKFAGYLTKKIKYGH